jgi:hypothetical protein
VKSECYRGYDQSDFQMRNLKKKKKLKFKKKRIRRKERERGIKRDSRFLMGGQNYQMRENRFFFGM